MHLITLFDVYSPHNDRLAANTPGQAYTQELASPVLYIPMLT